MKNTKIRRLNKNGHRSNLETEILGKLKRAKNIQKVSYEDTKLTYTLRKNYVPDFTIITKDGRTIYIEVKGWFRPEDRTKMRAVKEANPNLDVRLVFGANNRLNKDSQVTYVDWCNKHGFPCCVKKIPLEWFW